MEEQAGCYQTSEEHLCKYTVNYIDIGEIEVLNSPFQAQRVLLTFKLTRIPFLLMKQKRRLNHLGIFPMRVFQNNNITLLLTRHSPMLKLSKPQESLCRKNNSESLNNRNPALKSIFMETEHLENVEERELLSSFNTLPSDEQKAINMRLDALRKN